MLFLATLSVNAQFGARIGVDFAKAKGTASDSYESATESESYTGYYFGIFGKLYISENFSLRPEANYYHFPKEESANLVDHVQVPLLFSVDFGDSIELLFGPSASYLFNTNDGVKSFNYSGNVGLVAKFNNFQIEGRYVRGFANLYDGDDYGYDVDLTIDAIQIGITYSVD